MYTQDVATIKETAAQAVSEFIRSPDLFQFDLFESPTITQLKDDSTNGHLYQLLEIILNGNLQVSPTEKRNKKEKACLLHELAGARGYPNFPYLSPINS